jgi:hypothetical protein
MIVVTYLDTMFFEIRGKRVDVEFSQEMVDLARKLALNPELVDRLDIETMTLREGKP